MRLLAVFPFLCASVAFILSMLTIFAGSKKGFLENADLLTLNTSMLGEFAFNKSSSSNSSHHSGILGDIEGDVKGWESDVKNDIEDKINGAIKDIAQALNIHDFYSAHLLDFCEGDYTPGPLVNATNEHPAKNITKCSNRTSTFSFDPTKILQNELKSGVNLTDLKWPSEIEDVIHTIEGLTKAMLVLYFIGAALAGLAVVGAIVALFGGGMLNGMVNFMIDFIAFLALGIASAISTTIIVKVVNAINKFGGEIGVAAYKGNKFIAFTWVATAMMLIASVGWIVDCCLVRRQRVDTLRDGKRSRV